jgi:hypothetical protein
VSQDVEFSVEIHIYPVHESRSRKNSFQKGKNAVNDHGKILKPKGRIGGLREKDNYFKMLNTRWRV